jgi:subfamily B ATP-binding cassette protein MsbA
MIGFLRLILDDMVDNPQERQQLIAESYKSAFKILNAVDVFDDMLNLHNSCQSTLVTDPNHTDNILNNISNEFRTHLNPMLYSLRSLVDDLIEQDNEEYKVIKSAYDDAVHLLGTLQNLEINYQK